MQDRFLDGAGAAPADFTRKMVACGATEAFCFETFRTHPESVLAPSGYVATFPSTAPFMRDVFVGVPMCAGLSVFAVTVPPHWEKKRTVPESELVEARTRVNKLVGDESVDFVAWNESIENEWTPGLGRGGFVGLFIQFPPEQAPRWFIVVQNTLDEKTLEDFENHLCEMQAQPTATYASVSKSFGVLETLAEESRKRLAAIFADALGVSFGSVSSVSAVHEPETEDHAKVAQWLGLGVSPAVRSYRVPRRVPRFVSNEDFEIVSSLAGKTVRFTNTQLKTAVPEWTVTWNTLRESTLKNTTVWFSDCVSVGTSTIVPELGDLRDTLVLRLAQAQVQTQAQAQSQTKRGTNTGFGSITTLAVPVICAPSAEDDPNANATDDAVVFNSDPDLVAHRHFEKTVLGPAMDKHALNQKMSLYPLMVRVSNRDYTGRVRSVAAAVAAAAETSATEFDVDFERLVREMFVVPGNEYVPPA